MISVEAATPDDVESVQEVLYQAWLATYPNEEVGVTEEDIRVHFEKSFTREEIEKRKAAYANMLSNERRIVAKENGRIVGVARGLRHEGYNQLQMIYVLPEAQRKGIGTLLWNDLRNFFGEDKDIIVEVATYNTQAIRFYEKLGFVDTGKRFEEERHRMPISGVAIPEMEMTLKKGASSL